MRTTHIKVLAQLLAQAKSGIELDERITGNITIRAEVGGQLHSEGCTAQFHVQLHGGSSVKYVIYDVKGNDLREITSEVMMRYLRDLREAPLCITSDAMPRPTSPLSEPASPDDEIAL